MKLDQNNMHQEHTKNKPLVKKKYSLFTVFLGLG